MSKEESSSNPFQRLAAAVYAEGEFSECTNVEQVKAAGLNDTLLLFLMSELSDFEDCNSPRVALDRLENIRCQLDELLSVFRRAVKSPESVAEEFLKDLSAHERLAFVSEWRRRAALDEES